MILIALKGELNQWRLSRYISYATKMHLVSGNADQVDLKAHIVTQLTAPFLFSYLCSDPSHHIDPMALSAVFSVFVLFLSSLAFRVRSECTSPTPISLPIQNVTLANGIKRRGFALNVGTPVQSMALALNA